MLVIPRVQVAFSKWLALTLCAAAFSAGPVLGQTKHKVDPVNPPDMMNPKTQVHRDAKAARTRCLTSPTLRAEDRVDGMVWYTGYILPLMTDEADLGGMSERRVELIADLARIKDFEFHTKLVTEAETYANRVLAGNYHPFARITAMHTIAHLNSVEVSVSQRVPTPYAPAMDVLLARLKDAKELDAVKAVALFGIRRHLTTYLADDPRTISAADLKKMTDALLPLINEKTPPGKRSAAGHAWMRGRAIEALAALGEPGKGLVVYNAFNGVLEEKDAPISLRCAAANGLGLLRYPNDMKADFIKSADAIALAAVASAERNLARFQGLKDAIASRKNKPSDRGGSGVGGPPGGAGGDPGGIGGPPGGLGGDPGGPPGGGADGGGLDGLGGDPGGLGGDPGGPAGGLGGGTGTANNQNTSEYPEFSVDNLQRSLRAELLCVQRGIRGTTKEPLLGLVGIAVVDPAKTREAEVDTAIENLLKLTVDEEEFGKVMAKLQNQVDQLKELVAPAVAPAADPLGAKSAEPEADPLGAKPADKGDEIPSKTPETPPAGGAKGN